jgi:hypothetical protein
LVVGKSVLKQESLSLMSTDLRYLPPTVVPYLNALSHKESDHELERDDFLAALQQFTDWWVFQSGYTLDDEEDAQFENLKLLHQEVRQALDLPDKQAQLDRLVPDLFQIVTLMDQINHRREAPHYSPQLAVNDFLMCGAAWLKERADEEAVEARLDRLQAYVGVLRHAFIGNKSRLLPEVVEALETGLNHLRKGIEDIDFGDAEKFQDGLASIAEGAEIMQHLIDWQRQDVARQAQVHGRFLIPEAGPDFQEALEQARQLPREQWRRGIRYLEENVLPRAEGAWQSMRQRIFWDPNQRLTLWHEIELGFEDVRAAVADLSDAELPEGQALDGLEEALEGLSQAFRQARAHSTPHQHLMGSQPGLYIEAILGGIHQTLPFVAFPELFHSSPPPEDWKPIVDAILEFGVDLEPDHLYRAGYLLLQRFPPACDESGLEKDWNCPSCGHSNSPQVTRCSNCHIAPVSLSATVWSG